MKEVEKGGQNPHKNTAETKHQPHEPDKTHQTPVKNEASPETRPANPAEPALIGYPWGVQGKTIIFKIKYLPKVRHEYS